MTCHPDFASISYNDPGALAVLAAIALAYAFASLATR